MTDPDDNPYAAPRSLPEGAGGVKSFWHDNHLLIAGIVAFLVTTTLVAFAALAFVVAMLRSPIDTYEWSHLTLVILVASGLVGCLAFLVVTKRVSNKRLSNTTLALLIGGTMVVALVLTIPELLALLRALAQLVR